MQGTGARKRACGRSDPRNLQKRARKARAHARRQPAAPSSTPSPAPSSRHHAETRIPGTTDAAHSHARAGLQERNGPKPTRGATSQHRVGRRRRGRLGRQAVLRTMSNASRTSTKGTRRPNNRPRSRPDEPQRGGSTGSRPRWRGAEVRDPRKSWSATLEESFVGAGGREDRRRLDPEPLQEVRVASRAPGQEAPRHLGVLVEADGDERDAPPGGRDQLRVLGHRLAAGLAPGRPEVDDHDLTAMGLKKRVERRSIGHGRRHFALGPRQFRDRRSFV